MGNEVKINIKCQYYKTSHKGYNIFSKPSILSKPGFCQGQSIPRFIYILSIFDIIALRRILVRYLTTHTRLLFTDLKRKRDRYDYLSCLSIPKVQPPEIVHSWWNDKRIARKWRSRFLPVCFARFLDQPWSEVRAFEFLQIDIRSDVVGAAKNYRVPVASMHRCVILCP